METDRRLILTLVVAASAPVLALSGCAETSRVVVSGVRDPRLSYPPFDGSEVVFHERAKGIAITRSGAEVLVWQGQYLSPPRFCKGRTIAYMVLAMPGLQGGRGPESCEPFRAVGFLASDIAPFARVSMICMPVESASGSEEVWRARCKVRARAVHVRPRASAEGGGLERVRKWDDSGANEWSAGVAHMRIVMGQHTRGEAEIEGILRRHYLRLSDDGQLVIVADGYPTGSSR